MRKTVVIFFALLLISPIVHADSEAQNWVKTYGGVSEENLGYVMQTGDAGFILAGSTDSFGFEESVDFLVVKTDLAGTVSWQIPFGLSYDDIPAAIQQTSDGGYIVIGRTNSRDFGAKGYDALIIKLDSAGGVEFNRTAGGVDDDVVTAVTEVFDAEEISDGFVLAGYTDTTSGGDMDVLVMMLTPVGFIRSTWPKTYGGSGDDLAYAIKQTSDNGYIIAGETMSFGAGSRDALMLKLDDNGTVVWQKAYGGTGDDKAVSIVQTQDGGYITAGETSSFGIGSSDALVLKLDKDGDVVWQKAYGGTGDDKAVSIVQTQDGGYVVVGETSSFGAGKIDALILKLDASGTVSWQHTFGGSGDDAAYSIQQTIDGGYVAAGDTDSYGAGSTDLFLLRFEDDEGLEKCAGEDSQSVSVTDISVSISEDTADILEFDATSAATKWNNEDSSAEVFTVCPQTDSDGDGIYDGMPGDTLCSGGRTDNCADNCPNLVNPDQADTDEDGIGNRCDFFALCPAERIFGESSETTESLRDFRDDVLTKTRGGREIIKSYYRWSPRIITGIDVMEELLNGGLSTSR